MIVAINYTDNENPILERNVTRWFNNPNDDLCVVYADDSTAIFELGVVEEAWDDQDTYDTYGGGPVVNYADDDTKYYGTHDRPGDSYAGP